MESTKISSKSITVHANINELYGNTSVTQYFKNETGNPLEISVKFPISKEVILKCFRVKINEKEIISKIMEKEKAIEKYTDNISSGNTGVLGNYTEDNNYSVMIGNLTADELLELTSEFIQPLGSEDKSHKYSFSPANLPIIAGKSTVFNNPQTDSSIKIDFTAQIETNSKLTRLISLAYEPNELKVENENKKAIFVISDSQIRAKSFESIDILFRTANINHPKLYEEYDPKLNVYSYSLNFLLDKRENIPSTDNIDTDRTKNYFTLFEDSEINDTPGVFIFLIDQSGSMSGHSIQVAKESLKLFIKSLPVHSYFDIIGFGSTHKAYTSTPYIYNEKNVKSALQVVESIQANLGGTNIYSPLEDVFKKRKYDPNLSRSIFLLTDGAVSNSQRCVDLISSCAGDFRVHALGLGHSVDRNFITNSGKAGKGTALFAPEATDLNKLVIKALNQALRPYFNNITLEFKDGNFEKNKLIEYPSKTIKPLIYQDEMINYSFISSTKFEGSSIVFNAFHPVKNNYISDILTKDEILFPLPHGNNLNKIIAGSKLKNDATNMKTDEVVKLSLQYQILSKETTLFAEVVNSNSNEGSGELVKVNMEHKAESVDLDEKMSRPISGTKKRCKVMKQMDQCKDSFSNLEQLTSQAECLGKLDICNAKKAEKGFFGKIGEGISNLFSRKKSDINPPKKCEEKSRKTSYNDRSSTRLESEHAQDQKISDYSNNQDPLKLIIDSQKIEGNWAREESLEIIFKHYQDIQPKLSTLISNTIKDKTSLENVVTTLLVLLYLYEKYTDKKDEFLLIANKGKKFVKNNGIDYKLIFKEIGVDAQF